MSANSDPLLLKRKQRAPIGVRIESYRCLACFAEIDPDVLPWVEKTDLVEGDDAGVPYECSKCGKPLAPSTPDASE